MSFGKVILVSAEKGPKVRMADFDDIMQGLQNAIGGWVEIISSNGYVFAIDEDGLLKKLISNPYGKLCTGVPIVGDFVITTYAEGDFKPLTDTQIHEWFHRMGIELLVDKEEEGESEED